MPFIMFILYNIFPVMAANKRSAPTHNYDGKKSKKGGGSQEDPSAFEMELALFEEEMDIDFSQESECKSTGTAPCLFATFI